MRHSFDLDMYSIERPCSRKATELYAITTNAIMERVQWMVSVAVSKMAKKAVLSEKVVINTPKEFSDFANDHIKTISVLYM